MISHTHDVAHDEVEPLQDLNQDLEVVDELKEKERLTFSNFILLAAAVLTVVMTVLAAVFATVSFWTVLPVTASFLLALAVAFTGLTETRWFYPIATWVVIVALFASGVYIAARGKQSDAGQLTSKVVKVLKLHFVLTSPATVPWCKSFLLTTTGSVPRGYEILVFDASTDAQYDVTSLYHYDGAAVPVERVAGEWMITSVYIGSQYKQNARGQNVLRNRKPVSNEGYTVAVVALLVPDSDGNLLQSVMAHDSKRLLKPLPPRPLATAKLDTIRNNVAKECPRGKG